MYKLAQTPNGKGQFQRKPVISLPHSNQGELARCRRWGPVCAIALLFATAGCRVRRDVPEGPTAEAVIAPASSLVHEAERLSVRDAGTDAPLVLDAGDPPEGSFVLVFGGLESAPERPEPERRATQVALAALAAGRSPVDAAVDAVTLLEDDPGRNAGYGSALRIDGVTIEMDAAVMAEDGRFGAVAALSRVKNPVQVARAVFDTPQRLLTGMGARRFARSLGHAEFDPTTPGAQASYRSLLASELAQDAGAASLLPPGWQSWVDASAYSRPVPEAGTSEAGVVDGGADDAPDAAPSSAASGAVPPASPPQPVKPKPRPAPVLPPKSPPRDAGHDTVAALVRSRDAGFAGAVSSGGPPLALPGRVGDVPTPGAALWVGKRGAVAVTGPGERIVDLGLARAVYDKLVALRSTKLAAAWGAKQLPAGTSLCVAVLDAKSFAVEPADAMAWVGSEGDKTADSAGEDKR